MLKKIIIKLRNKFIGRPEDVEILIKRGLKIGNNCEINNTVIIDPAHCWHIEIGDNVTIAEGVYILAHDASTEKLIGYTKVGNIKIGNSVFIGARSIILQGVTIGNNSIIGAGSIISKDVPNNVVMLGNPAKIICSIEEYTNKHREKIREDIKFDESYTIRGNISEEMKLHMREQAAKGTIYVE